MSGEGSNCSHVINHISDVLGREKPVQPAVENLYAGTDPTDTTYRMCVLCSVFVVMYNALFALV